MSHKLWSISLSRLHCVFCLGTHRVASRCWPTWLGFSLEALGKNQLPSSFRLFLEFSFCAFETEISIFLLSVNQGSLSPAREAFYLVAFSIFKSAMVHQILLIFSISLTSSTGTTKENSLLLKGPCD